MAEAQTVESTAVRPAGIAQMSPKLAALHATVGRFRQNLEETGMSYAKEVEMVRLARGIGLLTTPYCFEPAEARMMAAAGADVVVAHMGLTTSGSIGATTTFTLDECVDRVQDIADAARDVNPDVLVIAHGGPISMPEDAQFVLERTHGVHGFYGASSMERLPVEVAITEQMRRFKGLHLAPRLRTSQSM